MSRYASRERRLACDRPYVDNDTRRMLLRGGAVHRSEVAYQWLLSIARERDPRARALVIEELGIYKDNAKLKTRLAATLSERADVALVRLFEREWAPPPQ